MSGAGRARRAVRWLGLVLAAIAAVLLLAIAWAWWWSGTQASLDWALRRFGEPAGLQVRQATGSLREGVVAQQLKWEQDGLAITAQGVELAWNPLALLSRRVEVGQLRAEQVQVVDGRPKKAEPDTPPQELTLPMAVAIDSFSVNQLLWQGPATVQVRRLTGSYGYSDNRHRLGIRNAELDQGHVRGELELGADGQLPLQARLQGQLKAPIPGSEQSLPLRFEATAEGPLTDFVVRADVQVVTAPAPTQSAPAAPPTATITAQVAPWAEPPVTEAQAQVSQLDLSSLWPEAPSTRLQGELLVKPDPTGGGWVIQADVHNDNPGPWDKQRLPASRLVARAEWQPDGLVRVPRFRAEVGGGTAVGQGRWSQKDGWAIEADVRGVDPSQAYTELGNERLTGQVKLSGKGEEFEFEIDLRAPSAPGRRSQAAPDAGGAAAQALRVPSRFVRLVQQGTGATQAPAASPAPVPQPGAEPAQQDWQSLLRALNLRQLIGKARFSKGVLYLPEIDVVTNNARLRGSLEVKLKEQSAQGQLTLDAPGLAARFDGSVAARRGGGTLRAQASHLARATTWLQTLPGLPAGLIPPLDGEARLQLEWQGGWQDPTLQARLDVDRLALPSAAGEPGGTPLVVRDAVLTLTGDLDDARVQLNGRVAANGLQARVDLAGNLNRLEQAWLLRLRTLQVAASGLGATPGEWLLQLRQPPVTVRWQPGGALEAGAGQAVITSPVGPGRSQAQIAWERTRWTEGELVTAGQVQRLPLSWIQLFTGQDVLGPRVSGDLQFAGEWRARLGQDTPELHASLRHTAGELTFQTETGRGETVPVTAGIRQLRLTLDNEGQQVRLAVQFESERAGNLQGQITTRLVPGGPLGWQLPPDPPLQTSGQATGLTLSMVQLFTGTDLLGPQLTGDLQFRAEWQARLGADLNLQATLERTGGDLTVLAETTGGQTVRVPAGIREARLTLQNEGQQVRLSIDFESERAGSLQGAVSTRLAEGGALGWQLPPQAPLTGQLQAQLPRLRTWSVLAPPGWRVRGSLQADVQVGGTIEEPRLNGLITADDLAVRSIVEGVALQGGRLRARLEGQRLVIEELVFQGAGAPQPGTLRATGVAELGPEGPRLALDAQLDQLRASVRTDRQLTVSGDARATVGPAGVEITGDLRVDRALIVIPEETAPRLGDDVVVYNLPQGVQLRTEVRAADDGGMPLRLALTLDLGNDFLVRGRGINAGLRGQLQISATDISEPRVTGAVNIVNGEFAAYGQRLEIERGLLRFTGEATNPSLDILAVRPRLEPKVGVQVTGNAQSPDVRLYSATAMTEAEKLSWLVLGRGAAAGGAEAALLQRAALALLAERTGREGAPGGIAGVLGLDELSVRRDEETGAAFVLGKRFAENIYATYERSLSGALGTLYVFYDITQRLSVRAEAGDRTAVDLIYRFSYD